MARKKKEIPVYGTVIQRGVKYYRTRLMDADGRRVALYAQTPEELYEKVREAQRQIEEAEDNSDCGRVLRTMAHNAIWKGTCHNTG